MTTEHIIIIIGGVWLSETNEEKNRVRLEKPIMGEKVVNTSNVHVARNAEHPEYSSNPPTSGWHWGGATAGAGLKSKSVADELVIHSMEHGAAVVWYRSDLEESEVDEIKEAFRNASGKKIMLPRINLDVPVALTSWNYLLKLEAINKETIKEFIETNNDRAPEKASI